VGISAEEMPDLTLLHNFLATASIPDAWRFSRRELFNASMPAIAFGLGSKAKACPPKPAVAGLKRKQILFDDDGDDDDTTSLPAMENVNVLDSQMHDIPPPSKSPRLSNDTKKNGKPPQQYTNLSALHTAKRHTEEASTVDSTLYDYDAVYDSFQAPKKKASDDTKATVPKYMSNLLKSAEVRKRDQLRAKERLIQREREAEGDEFADKEKFVTGAYKAQQEENRKLEEAEAAREAAEEEKRRKGGGMTGFYKELLKKDEQRSTQISMALKAGATNSKTNEDFERDADETAQEKSAAKIAAELNARGAKVAINDEGEVVDKRQLLSAGLNVAPKPKTGGAQSKTTGPQVPKGTNYPKSSAASSAREAQRERQTRMMAEQLEKMAEQQAQAEAEEQRALEEKAKSQKTGTDISSAKERYLARKKAQEAEKAKRSGT
jgi:coiled-coil domain-containing protein 55